jgi:hypothetical protein
MTPGEGLLAPSRYQPMDSAPPSRWIDVRNASVMPYVPYWFESFASWFPWIVPVLSLIGLWIARLCDDDRVRSVAEHAYYCAMILAAVVTLRTILADDHCWLLHTGSFGMMVLGAVFPNNPVEADWSTFES